MGSEFVVRKGLIVQEVLSGDTISLLGITSGGTVVNGSSMYSEICESCSGSFPSSGITIDTGTTITIFSENSEPIEVDCVAPKCCTQWTVTYRDGGVKQEFITTNYDEVLKYKETYNAHVKCSDSNNTGVNTGGIYWTSDPDVLPIPTYDTKPATLTGVVYEDIIPTSSTVNEIRKSYKVQLQNTSYTEINQSSFIAVSESTLINVSESINGVIDSSVMVEMLASTDGYIDGSNRIFMVASDDSTIIDATTSSIISSTSSVISGGTSGTTIISGNGIIATEDDTLYTDNLIITDTLSIGSVGGGTPIFNLGVDSGGNVVTGTTGGAFVHTSSGRITPTNTYGNTVTGDYSTIAGGGVNVVGGIYTFIGGGQTNVTNGNWSVIGGGQGNTVSTGTTGSVIVGGTGNTINTTGGNNFSDFIGAGNENKIYGYSYGGGNFIGGGGSGYQFANGPSYVGNTINGGSGNVIVGGYYGNIISGGTYGNIIGGGQNNVIGSGADRSVIVGGKENSCFNQEGFIGGGKGNRINQFNSSIVGGQSNTVNHQSAHIIGSNITSVSANTTHVEKLNIKTLNGTAINVGIGLDINGMVVSGSTGGGGVTIDPYNVEPSTTSLTWDVSGTSTNYETTLTGNTTLTMSNVRNGDYGTLITTQDGTGSHTLTFGAGTHKVVNGGGGSPTLTTTAGAIDILSFTYDGSTFYWTVGNDYT
jgi:hypothetical protein